MVLFPEQRVQTCRIYEPLRPLLPSSCPTWVQKRGNSGQNGGEGKHGVQRQAVKKTLFLQQQLALNKVTVSSGHAEGLENNEMPKQNDYKSYLNILTSSLHLSLKFIIFNSPIHFNTIANATLLWEDILLILI